MYVWSGEQARLAGADSVWCRVGGLLMTQVGGGSISPAPLGMDLGWTTFKFVFNPKIVSAQDPIVLLDRH